MLSRQDSRSVISGSIKQRTSITPPLAILLPSALEHRSAATADPAGARDVERDVIGCVTSLVPRLSETTFRPFFVRLLDWASRADAPPARVITFYR